MEIENMNKFIIGGNSTGKTRNMLEEAKKSGATVVCKNPYSMESKANCYGIYGLKFIRYEELNADIICGEKIAVDEIGDFFEYCFGAKLDAFTMTID